MLAFDEFDLLLVIAQLSVAIAGFASLASALGERNRRDEARVDAGRLINMLIVSLCTAILALVPFVPALFGYPGNVVWRTSAAIALATLVTVAPGVAMRARRMQHYAGFNTRSNFVSFGLTAIAAISFGCCAFGLPAPRLSASYVAGLFALLLICAILFFRVITSLLRRLAPE